MSETTKHRARALWRGDKRDLRAHDRAHTACFIANSIACEVQVEMTV
jgi:organic hydroperoxide reductase OsmC/OhrA